tara:strand:+ start:4274 stop:4516 length:243 start_codon:yes stop_codon:yes gene_type:complete
MKPNLPEPPSDIFGYRVALFEEADIDQELLNQYQYAKPSFMPGLWELFRPPNDNEGVPIPGTKGMTLPGDHTVHDLEKLV